MESGKTQGGKEFSSLAVEGNKQTQIMLVFGC